MQCEMDERVYSVQRLGGRRLLRKLRRPLITFRSPNKIQWSYVGGLGGSRHFTGGEKALRG